MTSRKNFIKLLLILLLLPIFSGCQILKSLDILSSKQRGVYHTVQEGQTLYFIARAYDTDIDQLKRINSIYDPKKLHAGVRLWIPGAWQVLEIGAKKSSQVKERVGRSSKIKIKSHKVIKPKKGVLVWPLKGQLASRFGNRNGRHHDGIDIAASKETPIVAAADGKVMFSGWGPTGYGLMLIIRHKNNLTTIYAHNSHNHVHKNQMVKQGQRIASVGSTGRSTGPHLHFEIRNDAHPQNPLNYLPK